MLVQSHSISESIYRIISINQRLMFTMFENLIKSVSQSSFSCIIYEFLIRQNLIRHEFTENTVKVLFISTVMHGHASLNFTILRAIIAFGGPNLVDPDLDSSLSFLDNFIKF